MLMLVAVFLIIPIGSNIMQIFMPFTLGLLLLTLPFLYISWKLFSTSSSGKKEAPQPAGKLPMIGHLHQLAGSTQPTFRLLGDLADKYGPIFTLYLGVNRTVVISSFELAKECFTGNDKVVASRPPTTFGKYMGYNSAIFGMAPYGPYWREVRKIVTLELLSPRQVELLKHIRITEVDLSIKNLYKQWTSSSGSKLPIMVDMKQWFGDLTFNIITKNLAGKRYFGDNVIGDEKEARKYKELIDKFLYLSGRFLLSDAIPWLEWLDFGGHIKAMKEVAKDLDLLLSSWLEEHRQWQGVNPGLPSRDFIDIMLSKLQESDVAGYDLDNVAKSTLLALMLAAADTTSMTLSWALALVLKNPLILKKAQHEIDKLIGKDRIVIQSDIKDLPYLQAIIKETLRLYPAAPTGIPHMTIEDCEIGNYHVPVGSQLLVNMWKIHRDPRVWEDPLEFRPERFLVGGGREFDFQGLNFEYIPFGSGRRMCPGVNLAQQVMHLTMARLLHGFDLATEDGNNIDMNEGLGITLTKLAPLQVILTPRLAPNLYI